MGKALAHLRHLIDAGKAQPFEMRAYACPRCGGFHVGHKSAQQRTIEAKRWATMVPGDFEHER